MALLFCYLLAALWYFLYYKKRRLQNEANEVNQGSPVVIGDSIEVAKSLTMEEGGNTTNIEGAHTTKPTNYRVMSNSIMKIDDDDASSEDDNVLYEKEHVFTKMGPRDDENLLPKDSDDDGNRLYEE